MQIKTENAVFSSGSGWGPADSDDRRFTAEFVYTRCRNCGCLRMIDEYSFEWLRIFGCFRCGYDDFQILSEDEWNIFNRPAEDFEIPY